jgi:hypothetical protein
MTTIRRISNHPLPHPPTSVGGRISRGANTISKRGGCLDFRDFEAIEPFAIR